MVCELPTHTDRPCAAHRERAGRRGKRRRCAQTTIFCFATATVVALFSAGYLLLVAMVACNNKCRYFLTIGHGVICRATNLPIIFYYTKVLLHMQNFALFVALPARAPHFSMRTS